ncbi:hypothetical protein D9M70_446090 [compost metagenome]
MDAFLRLGRIGGEAHLHQVRQAEAHHLLVEGQATVEGRRRDHRMAHPEVAGDEAGDASRGNEGGEVLLRAPEQLVTITVRIGEARQCLHLAAGGFDGASAMDLDIGGLELGDGLLEGGLAGHFPTAGAVAVTVGPLHQDAVGAVVHLQVKTLVRPGIHHHAEHPGGVILPALQVCRGYGDVAQAADIHVVLLIVVIAAHAGRGSMGRD